MAAGLAAGRLVEGVLHVGWRGGDRAFVIVPGWAHNVSIDGLLARNRALVGDRVVVNLSPGHAGFDGASGRSTSAGASEAGLDSSMPSPIGTAVCTCVWGHMCVCTPSCTFLQLVAAHDPKRPSVAGR